MVADVGDKNGLQCGGCSSAYLEVLRRMDLLFLQLCLLGSSILGKRVIRIFGIIRLNFAFVLSRVFPNDVCGFYHYLLMGQISELQQVMLANNRHRLISALSARPLREYILEAIM